MRFLKVIASAGVSLALCGLAAAQTSIVTLDIEPQPIAAALRDLGAQSGLQILFRADDVSRNGKVAPAVSGKLSAQEALDRLLANTGLKYEFVNEHTVRISSAHTKTVSTTEAADPPGDPSGNGLAQTDQGSPNRAAVNDPTGGSALSEIIVTATKRTQRMQDVPVSITAETGWELEHRGATQLQDIINSTPGLNNPGSGGGNSTNLTIRGVTTGTDLGLKQSTVALLYDDMPIDPIGQGGGASNLRVVDIERVEVLRGPQGTLFGSGSLAGALRYITNKPDLSQFSGSAEVTGADTQTGAASYSGNVVINAPIVQDLLGIRLVAYDYDDGGWISNLHTGEKDANPTKTDGARLAIAARPDDQFYANLTLTYQDSKDYLGVDAGSLAHEPPNTGFSGQVTDGINDAIVELKSAIAALTLQYDFDSVTLTSVSTYHDRQSNIYGIDTYFVPLTSLIATGGANIVQGIDNATSAIDGDIYTQELRLASRGESDFKWTTGAFFLHASANGSEENHSEAVIPVIGSDNIVDLNYHFGQQEIAGFGEGTYTFAHQWDLTGGLRVSRYMVDALTSTGGYIPVYSILPSAYVHTDFHDSGTPVDPRVSLAYRANPDLTLYTQVARGYRVGGLNLTSDVGGRNTPASYGPDSLWNYEVGAKGRAFDGRMTYSTALYYIDWSDIQVALENAIGNYTGNAGAARNYGLEFQVDTKPISWLQVGAAFQLSKNEIAKDDPTISRPATGLVGVKDGDVLPAAPEGQASTYAEVDFPVAGFQGYMRANATYLGDEWTDFEHNGTKFGGFATENLRAGINFGSDEVAAFINNLSNSQGATGALDAQTAGPVIINNQELFRIRPRTVGVTLRAKF
jgi:iron complex outermembrane receptor protein